MEEGVRKFPKSVPHERNMSNRRPPHCESRSGVTKRVDILSERPSRRSQWLALEATVCGMLVVLECREVWVAFPFFVFVIASYKVKAEGSPWGQGRPLAR